jgi:Na+-transporting NADH:ubiquinone oxidoreductase subunit NqrC
MEFTYEIDKKQALIIARENIIYGYGNRKKKAEKAFIFLGLFGFIGLFIVLIFKSDAEKLDNILIALSILAIILSILLYFKGEELQIKALQNQVKKAYKNKQILKYGVLVDDKQIAYYKKDNSTKSYPLNSIRRITYRNDLNGLFFSMSKLARYVFFIDLSNLDESQKEEVFTVLTNNLSDKDAQQELIKSIEESNNLETK